MLSKPLNWREIALIAESIKARLQGLFVDRVIIPERPRFPDGYIKDEFAIRFTGNKPEHRRDGDATVYKEHALLFSIRPRHAYLTWTPTKGPRAAKNATQSPFSLSASKHLKGAKLLSLEALPKERTVILWFSTAPDARLGLVINLIPAAPNSLLIDDDNKIIASSRVAKMETFIFPDGSKAPDAPPVREELFQTPGTLYQMIEKALDDEAFATRLRIAERSIKDSLKHAKDRLRQSETALKEAEGEPDWHKYGDTIKESLHDPGAIIEKLPPGLIGNHGLSLQDQMVKFYNLSRRKKRRISEAKSRADKARETIAELDKTISAFPAEGDWTKLEKLETAAGISIGIQTEKLAPHAGLPGKKFQSKEGLTILVGRDKTENLELTFKHARGNDIWFHVRGRPGAHAIIPLQRGKTASLETLLDAATLAIYYSGGKEWGKTEVDYTLKKYVKRIKGSDEASYTNNKTLIVTPDQERLKRLIT